MCTYMYVQNNNGINPHACSIYSSANIFLQEAAIFVREGEDNAKFFHHPKGRWSKLAFFILHHPAYYFTHLILTTLLLLLALLETPTSEGLNKSARTIIVSVSYRDLYIILGSTIFLLF